MKIFAILISLIVFIPVMLFSETAKPINLFTVQVENVDGTAATNLTVVVINSSTNAILEGTSIKGGSERVQTDSNGRFAIPFPVTNVFFMLATDKGFALAQSNDLTNNPIIIVQPWGRIEGVRINRNRPVANQPLKLYFDPRCIGDQFEVGDRIGESIKTTTDSKGHFVFERVPPMQMTVSETHNHPNNLWFFIGRVDVKPGETKRLELKTEGQTVIGRLDVGTGLPGDIDLTSCFGSLDPIIDRSDFPEIPKAFDTSEKRKKWWQDWYQTDAGIRFTKSYSGTVFEFRSDGSFIGEMVEPGKYKTGGSISKNGKEVAVLGKVFVEIPPVKTDEDNKPFDIGKIALKAHLKTGDIAPEFSSKTLDGKPLKLSDFRGKYVLLDFWATWCGPCVAEMPDLKEVHNTFGNDKRFAMISLSLDAKRELPVAYAKENDLHWTQVYLGDWSKDTVTGDYGVDGIPAIFLIGPDGKVIARNLRDAKIKEAVASALSSK